MMKAFDTSKKENKLGLVVLIISLFICFFTVSYALWKSVNQGQKENVVTTGTLILTLNEKSQNISLLDAVPLSDTSAKDLIPYTFSIKNSGTIDANYRLSIIDDEKYYTKDGCSNSKLDWSFLKYSLTENNGSFTIENLTTNSGIIKEGKLKAGEEMQLSLRLWLNPSTTEKESGKHFHGKIKLTAIQGDQNLSK